MAQLSERNAGKVLDILQKVTVIGVASIPTYELMYIYRAQRMTKGIWRDLSDRWQKLCEEDGYDIAPELLIGYEPGEHNVCFAFGKTINPETKTEEPWLRSVLSFLGEQELNA